MFYRRRFVATSSNESVLFFIFVCVWMLFVMFDVV